MFKKFVRKSGKPKATGKRLGRRVAKRIPRVMGPASIPREKKRVDISVGNGIIAQQNAGADTGFYFGDITPTITSGTGVAQRLGASVKVVSANVKLQIAQGTSCINPMRIELFIVKVLGVPQTINAAFVRTFKLLNPFSTFTDIFSDRDPDTYAQFRVIARRKYFLPGDQLTAMNTYVSKNIPIKFKIPHTMRYANDTTVLREGQIFMCAFSDSGNITGNTNATLQHSTRFYFVDP